MLDMCVVGSVAPGAKLFMYFTVFTSQGWVDALRTLHPDEPIFTFWDYFRQHWQRNAGLRIDHLLLNAPLKSLLLEAGVDRWVRGQPGYCCAPASQTSFTVASICFG